jgi:hypothetical protein
VAADPTRRVVIAAAAVLPLVAVSGCDGADVLASPPSPAPGVGLLRAAIAAEQLMITRYAAVPAPAPASWFRRSRSTAAATAMLDRLRGAPASLAQLFASISASEATHVPVLDDAVHNATGRAGG